MIGSRDVRVPTEEVALPTYQYACTECGHRFEKFQSFTDEALTTCPECSGRLRKVFNAVGVVFKGSGFYRTDSRKGADTADTAGKGKGERESKPESKPATAGTSTSDSGASRATKSTTSSSSEGSAA
jgi:putative FmdB family regulatory protein